MAKDRNLTGSVDVHERPQRTPSQKREPGPRGHVGSLGEKAERRNQRAIEAAHLKARRTKTKK